MEPDAREVSYSAPRAGFILAVILRERICTTHFTTCLFVLGACSNCDVTGARSTKSTYHRLLTPHVFNSAWILGLALIILQAGAWAFVAGRRSSDLDRLITKTLDLLRQVSEDYAAGLTVPTWRLAQLVAGGNQINSSLSTMKIYVGGWIATWVILGAGILAVSVVLPSVLVKMWSFPCIILAIHIDNCRLHF